MNVHGDVLDRKMLERGFLFEGERVPLLGPQGIFKPRLIRDVPLSITTVPEVAGEERPYDDRVGADGVLVYRYRGDDPEHHENRGLRSAMLGAVPLIYFKGLVPGRYMAVFPVFIVGDVPGELAFRVQVDDLSALESAPTAMVDEGSLFRRKYVTTVTVQRLHQRSFRERVVLAYRAECAVCRLRHEELLDAAHILRDGHPKGEPVVSNGLALCRLHHGAFDSGILGIRPDYVIEIRDDVLREIDGPMLKHGLQGFQGAVIQVPQKQSQRPNVEFLAERFEEFRRTA